MKSRWWTLIILLSIACRVGQAEQTSQHSANSPSRQPQAAKCPITLEQELGSLTATASAWANVRNAYGSLRYESARMLEEGFEALKGVDQSGCPSECEVLMKKALVFYSVPNAFLSNYADEAYCATLLQRTKANPLLYSKQEFRDIEALTDWYEGFSQGKNPEGEDLYARCDRSCSPQYQTLVSQQAGKLLVTAKVICGHARDKSDNQYKLKTLVQTTCSSSK